MFYWYWVNLLLKVIFAACMLFFYARQVCCNFNHNLVLIGKTTTLCKKAASIFALKNNYE